MHSDIVRRICEKLNNTPTVKLTLHKVARLNSTLDRNTINCNCRKGYTTKKCTCRKNGKECGQNCHGDDTDCGNIAEQIIHHIDKPIIIDSDVELTLTPLPPSCKRAAKLSSLNQPHKKRSVEHPPPSSQPFTKYPPSATNTLRGEPSRLRKQTQRGHESCEQQQKSKSKRKEKQQIVMSQFE